MFEIEEFMECLAEQIVKYKLNNSNNNKKNIIFSRI